MARLNANQAQSFPTSGNGTNFLQLQNDKDQAVVRFAYVNVSDIPIHLIHEVIGADGKNKQLGCLRTDYSQPSNVCPLCAAAMPAKKIIYFNVRNEETGEMQIWGRSEAYFKKNMETIFNEYTANGTPLCSIPFKIIRNGVKGDQKTTYTFIPLPADTMQLSEFPEDIVVEERGIVTDYEFDELTRYVQTGILPTSNNNNNNNNEVRSIENNVDGGRGVMNNNFINQAATQNQAPLNNNRRTMSNGGY